ncbi:hypothetical protein Hanom_Chr04g00315451 [Helianthus anomalus]
MFPIHRFKTCQFKLTRSPPAPNLVHIQQLLHRITMHSTNKTRVGLTRATVESLRRISFHKTRARELLLQPGQLLSVPERSNKKKKNKFNTKWTMDVHYTLLAVYTYDIYIYVWAIGGESESALILTLFY